MLVRASALKRKEVINVCDGRRLGVISDLELILPEGRIQAVVVPGPGSLGGLFRPCQPIVVPWCNIRKIGDDVIIVDAPRNYCKQLEQN
ncbi:MAG: YlmC/YmxH family sporulation protein [Eubacteriales bacterium]|nr:YlmC/YmxH family sporulation protein [Eubacteriales bacterium]